MSNSGFDVYIESHIDDIALSVASGYSMVGCRRPVPSHSVKCLLLFLDAR